ncbi:predicted protein [Lichtheimia corymbifera JMRC:FSU:9682]|uniref:Uncharacterized protein n=1 Tax=Lichtheimia corymbifera JMRC:FSU:9682 TaxID=1263082 RepID=A0A068SBT9_9FUNG|nr:predicted protein [Lichtheimia corymbifera JMRC:FSU:9682]
MQDRLFMQLGSGKFRPSDVSCITKHRSLCIGHGSFTLKASEKMCLSNVSFIRFSCTRIRLALTCWDAMDLNISLKTTTFSKSHHHMLHMLQGGFHRYIFFIGGNVDNLHIDADTQNVALSYLKLTSSVFTANPPPLWLICRIQLRRARGWQGMRSSEKAAFTSTGQ